MEPGSEATRQIANQLKKLNFYTFPQYLWLVLIYYLMINCIVNFSFSAEIVKSTDIPKQILVYNDKIMLVIEHWVPFVELLSGAVFISGMLIAFVRYLPFFESQRVARDAAYGFYVGIWLFIFVYTYKLYSYLGDFFPFSVIIIFILIELWNKLKTRFIDSYFTSSK